LAVQRAAYAAAERRGDAFEQAVSLGYLGIVHHGLGEGDAARVCAERAGALAERDGRTWTRGFAAYAQAAVAGRDGEAQTLRARLAALPADRR
jgi:hypothetical protein